MTLLVKVGFDLFISCSQGRCLATMPSTQLLVKENIAEILLVKKIFPEILLVKKIFADILLLKKIFAEILLVKKLFAEILLGKKYLQKFTCKENIAEI